MHRRVGVYIDDVQRKLEMHSKLTIALSILEEGFERVTDNLTNTDIMKNVTLNCGFGTNYIRLNHTGFYTLILEKGEEVISVATLRIHGVNLAEMPFISTRPEYRMRKMGQKVFNAVETILGYMNVEKLVIPSIPEAEGMWANKFGFHRVEAKLMTEISQFNTFMSHSTVRMYKPILPIANLPNIREMSFAPENDNPGSGNNKSLLVASGIVCGGGNGNGDDRCGGESSQCLGSSAYPTMTMNDTKASTSKSKIGKMKIIFRDNANKAQVVMPPKNNELRVQRPVVCQGFMPPKDNELWAQRPVVGQVVIPPKENMVREQRAVAGQVVMAPKDMVRHQLPAVCQFTMRPKVSLLREQRPAASQVVMPTKVNMLRDQQQAVGQVVKPMKENEARGQRQMVDQVVEPCVESAPPVQNAVMEHGPVINLNQARLPFDLNELPPEE